MTKVYLINLSFGLAGIERRFANLWRVLDRRGVVDPILVIPSALEAALKEAGLLPGRVSGLITISEPRPMAWLADLGLPPLFDTPMAIIRSRVAALGYRKVWQAIARDPHAVIHIGMNASGMRPPLVPTVYECVDSTLTQLGTGHFRRAARRRCIVHCQTTRIRTALDETYQNRQPRWRTVINPTCFASLDDSHDDFEGWAERDPRLVAFVGRLAREKSPLLFLEAVAEVRRRGIDCRAIILGEGPLRRDCEQFIAQNDLEPFVSISFVSKPAAYLRRSSIYVSLQTGDNYPSQSLLEAMGAGCAIVASDVGETWRIVTEDVGFRVPLKVEPIASALESLLLAPERAEQFGTRAEEVAGSVYSADSYAEYVENLYQIAAEFHRAG